MTCVVEDSTGYDESIDLAGALVEIIDLSVAEPFFK
jgi:hypothetical protein